MIDGDRLLFHRSLIEQGYQGGRQAAQDFTKAVAQELVEQGFVGFERLSFWITIYLNKRAVVTALREEGMASPDQLEAFLVGFGQASPRFVIMDSGPGRENVEAKVKGEYPYIRLAPVFPCLTYDYRIREDLHSFTADPPSVFRW